ncbi:hypothetical protein GQ600_21815 [Phytophthora cactorum]|nr:hypothetical protein GQ600_21815 [Phytophthora cactorum]
MVEPMGAGKRPVLTTRRSSQGGIAMSLEMRPPRELLEKIGIKGKEIARSSRTEIGKSWSLTVCSSRNSTTYQGAKKEEIKLNRMWDFFRWRRRTLRLHNCQGKFTYLLGRTM